MVYLFSSLPLSPGLLFLAHITQPLTHSPNPNHNSNSNFQLRSVANELTVISPRFLPRQQPGQRPPIEPNTSRWPQDSD